MKVTKCLFILNIILIFRVHQYRYLVLNPPVLIVLTVGILLLSWQELIKLPQLRNHFFTVLTRLLVDGTIGWAFYVNIEVFIRIESTQSFKVNKKILRKTALFSKYGD